MSSVSRASQGAASHVPLLHDMFDKRFLYSYTLILHTRPHVPSQPLVRDFNNIFQLNYVNKFFYSSKSFLIYKKVPFSVAYFSDLEATLAILEHVPFTKPLHVGFRDAYGF